jgi:glycosyltransferase involved in cell wall biosynthesis
VEKRRGIPFARNAAVRAAVDTDFIAFIDDDEEAEPDWLQELLVAQARYDADVVFGPVLSKLPDATPAWIRDGGFFDRSHPPTGTRIKYFATGNLLVRIRLLIAHPFDSRFALTGGSDTFLALQFAREGYVAVSGREARVWEYVPPSRVNGQWLIQRAFRYGTALGRADRFLCPPVSPVAVRAIKGGGQIVTGALMLLVSVVLGRARQVQALQLIARGAGAIIGLCGGAYEEYRRIHA